MKRLLFFFCLVCTFSAFTVTCYGENIEKDKNTVGADGLEPRFSILRMQNKVIAGLEVSVNPSVTLLDEFLNRTLASFRIGYRLNNNVLTGSIGVEFADEMFMPLTIDYKYYFKRENVWSPYFYGQAGYSWHLKGNIHSRYNTSKYSQYDPGALGSIGFGYSYTTTLNEFYFSLGYSFRNYVEGKPGLKDGLIRTDRSMKGVALNVGVNF